MTEKLPLYHKLSIIIIGLFIFFYILFISKEILVPLAFAWLLAILLNPIVNYLQRKKINKILAIVLAILLMMLVSAAILFFIGSQVAKFTEMIPELKQKINELGQDILSWF